MIRFLQAVTSSSLKVTTFSFLSFFSIVSRSMILKKALE